MIILEDTRNKPDKHKLKNAFFEKNNVSVQRTKLYVGDYTLPTNQSVCIDTKENLNEVVSNIIHQHERFRDECIRAQAANIKLIVLIEETNIKTIDDIKKWENPRLHRYNKIKYMHSIGKWLNVPMPKGKPPVNNIQIIKILTTMQNKYGVQFMFCTPDKAGATILNLLGGKNE